MSIFLMTPHEATKYVAHQIQTKRLSLNFSQKSLSERSGVSFGVLKKFERTGKISLESLFKIALVLGLLEDLKKIFEIPLEEQYTSLDALLTDKTRKRGRQ